MNNSKNIYNQQDIYQLKAIVMTLTINSKENLQFILPLTSDNEIKHCRVLIGEKGSKKKKSAIEKVKEYLYTVGSAGRALFATSTLQHLRALSSHEKAISVLKELDLDTDYLPIITTDVYWGDVLQKAIPDLKNEEVILPLPEFYLKFKYKDGKYYVVYIGQGNLTSGYVYKPLQDYVPNLSMHKEYGNMSDSMIDYVSYLLLAFEIKLANLVTKSGTNISFEEGLRDKLRDRSIEYRLTPALRSSDSSSEQSTHLGKKVKFHFRRAHWRTYSDGKRIRIGWTFVGDIRLGFVDKDYVI